MIGNERAHQERERAEQAEQTAQQEAQARRQAERAQQEAIPRLLKMGLSAEQVAEALNFSIEVVRGNREGESNLN